MIDGFDLSTNQHALLWRHRIRRSKSHGLLWVSVCEAPPAFSVVTFSQSTHTSQHVLFTHNYKSSASRPIQVTHLSCSCLIKSCYVDYMFVYFIQVLAISFVKRGCVSWSRDRKRTGTRSEECSKKGWYQFWLWFTKMLVHHAEQKPRKRMRNKDSVLALHMSRP